MDIDKLIAEKVMKIEKIHWPIKLGAYTPPPYSTNIADAWLVVEKLRKLGWQMTIFQNDPTLSDGYSVQFNLEDKDRDQIGWSEGVAETAPIAICKAALEAIKGE